MPRGWHRRIGRTPLFTSAIGVATGDTRLLHRYLDLGDFDVILSHNRFTLVDRSADELFARAVELGVGVLNAAVYGGGILARPGGSTKYSYKHGRDSRAPKRPSRGDT